MIYCFIYGMAIFVIVTFLKEQGLCQYTGITMRDKWIYRWHKAGCFPKTVALAWIIFQSI